jgi:hypothetical protein
MSESDQKNLTGIGMSTSIHLAFLTMVVFFMGNLNALVDAVLHPEIPYLDSEHLIVGISTALGSTVLFGGLMMYVRHLSNALATIRTLEAFLPIRSHRKKIRNAGADPGGLEAWQPIEAYLTERTPSQFSHGICPECLTQLFPETARRLRKESMERADRGQDHGVGGDQHGGVGPRQ